MARKTVSLGLTTQVRIEDHFTVKIDGKDNIIFSVISGSCQGTELGKAVEQYLMLENTDVSKVKHVVLDVRSDVDISMALFMLAASPAVPANKTIGVGLMPEEKATMSIKVNFYSKNFVTQILNAILNTANGSVGILQTLVPFFEKKVEFIVRANEMNPNDNKKLFMQMINTIGVLAVSQFRVNEGENHAITSLQRSLIEFHQKHVTYLPSEGEVQPFREGYGIPTLSEPLYNRINKGLLSGEILGNEKDQTGDLFCLPQEGHFASFDAGNPVAAAYLIQKMKESPKSINLIHLMLTHTHIDHVAYLIPILLAANEKGILVHLYGAYSVNPNMEMDVDSVVTTHSKLFSNTKLIDLSLLFLKTYLSPDNAFSSTAIDPPSEIAHFYKSNGYVVIHPSLKNEDETMVRIDTGDINPTKGQTVDQVSKSIQTYFNMLTDVAIHLDGKKSYEMRMELGHFKGMENQIQEDLEGWKSNFERKNKNCTVVIYYSHLKNVHGTVSTLDGKPISST
ncbi:MAG: hypothetical protein AABZ14_04520 [Candidatus Margulisiibacteriota bacterium]